MTDKDLKRLQRKDLLEMLVEYGEQNEILEAQLALAQESLKSQEPKLDEKERLETELASCRIEILQLQQKLTDAEAKLSDAQKKLQDRTLALSNAGSIAEASLAINGVFTAAQRAADQYLENVKAQYAQTDRMCQAREEESRIKVEKMMKEAELRCGAMEQHAKAESERYWKEASSKLKEMIESHSYLQTMFQYMNNGK